ncbi:HET-domain-containing protein [Achaetomium macrosporum]|uniref:HET-domain-containing protein n=1 Tax=Achaetomium macrosporum TaxID=79813 RepID=A0AAN7CIJ1_9PEZI|nr:HET-domain-containing protein [Achaetomium macrosporum]
MDQSASIIQHYRALPDGHIRLLSLQPSADGDAQIECTLSSARIEERPYEALSYVWGQEDPIHAILVDGEQVLVRPNLYGALKELRLTDQPRTLWVDSICINQSDVDERNRQVRQMDRVYSSAVQVVVWLGRGDGDTDAAIDFVRGLAELDAETADRIVSNKGLPWEDRERVFRALGMRHGLSNHDRVVGGLVKLMSHAWWKRMWTVQEIVLSRSADLRCGSKSASWSHLSQLAAFAFEVARHSTLGFGRPMDEAVFDEMTGEVSKLYVAVSGLNRLSYKLADGADTSLEQLAWSQLLTRQATDPRDMIFALLGLVTQRARIEIDYGKSKEQVYTSAMKAMLQENREGPWPLHFLQECYLERDPALPSWVPDFGILHSFKTTTLATSGVGAVLTLAPLYNASLGESDCIPPVFLEDDAVLEMQGVWVDQAEHLGPVCPRFPADWEGRQAQLRVAIDQWRELVPKKQQEEYIAGASLDEAFWRTVTFDLLLTDRDYLAGHPDRRDTRLPKGTPGMPPTTAEQEAEILEGVLDAPLPKTVLEKLGERRFFVTRVGYFGLGPAAMRAGDVVCVLRGGFFPFIIRPASNNRYLIIGEW